MAKLIMSLDGSIVREIALDKNRVTIGRRPTNDVQIDNLGVSGEHAVIAPVASDWVLEDLGSTNGTLVNGAPIKKHVLQANDLIQLGKYKLKFIGGQPAPQAAPARPVEDIDKTMVLQVGASASRPAARRTPPPPPPPPQGTLERLKSWFKSLLK